MDGSVHPCDDSNTPALAVRFTKRATAPWNPMPDSEKTDTPTLLVVDDEVAVRRSLGRLLSRQGFHVVEAGTLEGFSTRRR